MDAWIVRVGGRPQAFAMSNLLRPFCVVWFSSILVAQTPQWRLHPVATPTFVTGAQLSYDHLRDRVVRFGGSQGYQLSSGLFELDGDDWAAVVAVGPSGRVSHVMAFDDVRAETVVYGGAFLGPTFWTDTWRWNGTSWSQAVSANVPSAMYEPAMCYDEARRCMVLNGAGQTWEWNGTNWQQRLAAHTPGARSHHTMAYDASRQRTVLFGGRIGATDQFDTWEWDGVNWVQRLASGPNAAYPSMAFDRERRRCVMLGHAPGQVVGAEYDGVAWTVAPVPLPMPGEPNLVYDRQRGRVVCWSARDVNGGPAGWTWSYESVGLAVAQPYGVGCGTPTLVAVADPTARPLLGGTFGIDIVNMPTPFAFVCIGWTNRQFGGAPLPTTLASVGMPQCLLLQSLDVLSLPAAANGPGSARFTTVVPQDAQLLGVRFFAQPWAIAPGANVFGGIMANGIAVTVGSW